MILDIFYDMKREFTVSFYIFSRTYRVTLLFRDEDLRRQTPPPSLHAASEN
jgi:hypothetical protein